MPEDVAFLDLEIQEHAGSAAAGLVVFQQPEMELYQGLVEAAQGLQELRSLYVHLQARTLEIIETLDELRACPELEIFKSSEEDESVIERIVSVQRKELEEEIAGLREEAERVAEEARELAGEVPF